MIFENFDWNIPVKADILWVIFQSHNICNVSKLLIQTTSYDIEDAQGGNDV